MRSFVDLDRTFGGQPARLGAQLARLDFGRGQEQMYRDQLPELLVALAETTRVASITASNAIEGVIVDPDRRARLARVSASGAQTVRYRNRNEREFAGYRDAVDQMMRAEILEPITVPYILHLHRQLFGYTDGGGGRLKIDQNLIVGYEDGRRTVLFNPASPKDTPFLLGELVDRYREAVAAEAAHPVVLVGALILDFLAIHPVADGNGRLSRLLTAHALMQHGYGVFRYVSVEQRVFETKNAYYAALRASQERWHSGTHDVWPWITYLVAILADGYRDFERRIAARRGLSGGSKQARVREYVLHHAPEVFRIRDIRAALPGISDPSIRLVLNGLRGEGLVQIDEVAGGAGRQAAWRRLAVEPSA